MYESQGSDVLARARHGDERAFQALYRAAQPGLLRYLSVLVGPAAEEIAARTWVDVGRDLGSFAGSLDGFRGWVAGIGRRHALDFLAGLQVTHSDLPVTSLEPTAGPTPPRAAHALGLIAELPREEAEAITLRSVMGLDEAETASVMGMRRGALRRTAVRGLRALTRRLDVARELPVGEELEAFEPEVRPVARVITPPGRTPSRLMPEVAAQPAVARVELGTQGIEVPS